MKGGRRTSGHKVTQEKAGGASDKSDSSAHGEHRLMRPPCAWQLACGLAWRRTSQGRCCRLRPLPCCHLGLGWPQPVAACPCGLCSCLGRPCLQQAGHPAPGHPDLVEPRAYHQQLRRGEQRWPAAAWLQACQPCPLGRQPCAWLPLPPCASSTTTTRCSEHVQMSVFCPGSSTTAWHALHTERSCLMQQGETRMLDCHTAMRNQGVCDLLPNTAALPADPLPGHPAYRPAGPHRTLGTPRQEQPACLPSRLHGHQLRQDSTSAMAAVLATLAATLVHAKPRSLELHHHHHHYHHHHHHHHNHTNKEMSQSNAAAAS